ncbi:cysteine desulfurase [Methanocalculus sp. AMF5]|uniref:cysteine desulfurase family protein n=1 Tax=Methanocalculus sp. AMF5 TaxID=1198257 RepID=UPI0020A1D160|nr:cysteine desulfurase family protein [Methanocalculus sp. AMF5]MCP1662125.1 cysteine desulfurase [Methanocalculus sp. AMF5]
MIYADNAATTRISDRAFEQMLPFLHEQYGNASSQYSLGIKARRAVEKARRQFAASIGANPSEITFTSGGSEANSWVLRCIAETYLNDSIHIITSTIEHHSVLNACHALKQSGAFEVTFLPVDNTGRVSVEDVKAAIRDNTKLVSIMFANNEIGTIQPIAEIGRILCECGILFHTDAVQAVGHIPVSVSDLQVDFLTASAHKFNGPKGVGMLYKRSGLELPPLIFGGEQERGLRAGTENVAGIVAAGYAIEESIAKMDESTQKLTEMVYLTVKGILTRLPAARLNGDFENRLPGIINFSFDGASGGSLMHLLDLKGICVSTSSACNSGQDTPSHVLLALGLTEEQAKSAIRISYGRYNTVDQVEAIISAVCEAYEKILSHH